MFSRGCVAKVLATTPILLSRGDSRVSGGVSGTASVPTWRGVLRGRSEVRISVLRRMAFPNFRGTRHRHFLIPHEHAVAVAGLFASIFSEGYEIVACPPPPFG